MNVNEKAKDSQNYDLAPNPADTYSTTPVLLHATSPPPLSGRAPEDSNLKTPSKPYRMIHGDATVSKTPVRADTAFAGTEHRDGSEAMGSSTVHRTDKAAHSAPEEQSQPKRRTPSLQERPITMATLQLIREVRNFGGYFFLFE